MYVKISFYLLVYYVILTFVIIKFVMASKSFFIPGNPVMIYCCFFHHPSITQNNLLVKAVAERYLCCS